MLRQGSIQTIFEFSGCQKRIYGKSSYRIEATFLPSILSNVASFDFKSLKINVLALSIYSVDKRTIPSSDSLIVSPVKDGYVSLI